MTDETGELREKVLAVLRRNDVKRAALFGSIVRGEMTDESDVEVLVEFADRKSLMDLSGRKIAARGGGRHNRRRPSRATGRRFWAVDYLRSVPLKKY